MSIESVMASNHLILYYPLLLLPSIFPGIMVFSSESALHIKWLKYWSTASAPVLLMNIQCWFPLGMTDLISLQSTGLQHHSSKAPILWCSAFFNGSGLIPVSDCWKNIAWTIWTFVGKVMSLLFNALFRCVIAFLPRSKCLLISWLQSMPTVILEPKKMKSDTVSIFPPFYLPRSDRTGCHDLHFFFFECWF